MQLKFAHNAVQQFIEMLQSNVYEVRIANPGPNCTLYYDSEV